MVSPLTAILVAGVPVAFRMAGGERPGPDDPRIGVRGLDPHPAVAEHAHGHAEEFEQRAVIFGVTLRQIVVDGNDVNAFTGQRVQVSRQRCGQGFTFTGTHFRDAALVEHHTTQQLDVEVAHAEYALTRFAHDSKRFRDQAF